MQFLLRSIVFYFYFIIALWRSKFVVLNHSTIAATDSLNSNIRYRWCPY